MIYKSETLFELMQIEVQCSKKNLRQETGAFGNKIEIEKGFFLQKYINFVEQQSQIFSL